MDDNFQSQGTTSSLLNVFIFNPITKNQKTFNFLCFQGEGQIGILRRNEFNTPRVVVQLATRLQYNLMKLYFFRDFVVYCHPY